MHRILRTHTHSTGTDLCDQSIQSHRILIQRSRTSGNALRRRKTTAPSLALFARHPLPPPPVPPTHLRSDSFQPTPPHPPPRRRHSLAARPATTAPERRVGGGRSAKMISRQLVLTYLYLLIYVCLSSGVILFNKVRLCFIPMRVYASLLCFPLR